MSQRILGIDIGSYSIKIAEIERSFRSFQLVGFFEQPILFSENLSREGAMNRALLKLFEEYNLSTDQLYTALPGQITSHRTISFPFADFKKVDATIEFEIESYVPLPLEDLLIDYQFLDFGRKAKKEKSGSDVLVSYAKKAEFVKFLDLMREADLDPHFVGSEPVEMANVAKLGLVTPEGAYALVDLGHEKTNILILIGSYIQYARTILIGGKDLTQAISEALHIPPTEAEKMKIDLGQVGMGSEGMDATTRAISEALQGPLSDLLLHLRQTFVSFQETKGEVVQSILLSGGTSRLSGIDHFISSGLHKNVSLLDCFDFPFNRLSDSNWCRPIGVTALALAYRGVLGTGVRGIQFRRGEFAYQGAIRDLVGMAKQVGFLLGLVTLFAIGSFGTNYILLKGRVQDQRTRVAEVAGKTLPDIPKKTLTSPNTVLSLMVSKLSEGEEKERKISEETSLSVMNLLKEISSALPSRDTVVLDVDDLSIIARRIKIQGKANSFEAVDQIKSALSRSKFFKNVSTENVRKGIRDEVRFNLSLEYADKETHELREEGT